MGDWQLLLNKPHLLIIIILVYTSELS